MFLLFVNQLCAGTNSPGPMCQGVKDALFCKEVVAGPIEVLVYVGGFPMYRD